MGFTLQQKLECITEFHPWFTKEEGKSSPWGREILPPECLNAIMLGGYEADKWPDIPEDKWLRDASVGRTPVGLFDGASAMAVDDQSGVQVSCCFKVQHLR